jgi:hypothetical protein
MPLNAPLAPQSRHVPRGSAAPENRSRRNTVDVFDSPANPDGW